MPSHISMVFSNKTQSWNEQQRTVRLRQAPAPSQRVSMNMNLNELKNIPKGCKSCGK